MKLTVAICTFNRARHLRQTLDNMRHLGVPEGVDWSILIVDNASTDDTPQVVSDFVDRLPLRMVAEPNQGLSHARNRAVYESDSDYIIWTDDDVLVGANWLAAYVEAFRNSPDAGFFGGPIVPQFEGSGQTWLNDVYGTVAGAFAARDLGPEPFDITDRAHLPYGANMVVRTDLQRRFRYDTELGRKGKALVGGEELEMLGKLLDEGWLGRWVPTASVMHLIPEERQTVEYMRRYFRAQGQVAFLRGTRMEGEVTWGNRPRWAFRAAVEHEIKFQFLRLVAHPPQWIDHLVMASFAQGILAGAQAPPSPRRF